MYNHNIHESAFIKINTIFESVVITANLLQISNRKYPKLKEVDDVLGGAAAWENVDSTEGESSD